MFNARNELDQSRFVDDLSESIAEMDEMEMIKTNNIIETIHFRYSDRLKRHSVMHSGICSNSSNNENSNIIIQPKSSNNTVLALDDNRVGKKLGLINNCDIRISANNEQPQQQLTTSAGDCKDNNSKQIVIAGSCGSANTTTVPSSDTLGDRHQNHYNQPTGRDGSHQHRAGKFSSMLNLSSATTDNKSDIAQDGGKLCGQSIASSSSSSSTRGLRQNQSFVQPPASRSTSNDQSGGGRVGGGEQVLVGFSGVAIVPNTTAAPPAAAAHRRCSSSSVHSLDSGLFLSRDVSPNQSS